MLKWNGSKGGQTFGSWRKHEQEKRVNLVKWSIISSSFSIFFTLIRMGIIFIFLRFINGFGGLESSSFNCRPAHQTEVYLEAWLRFHIKLRDKRNRLCNDVNIKGRSVGRHDVHKQQTGRYRQQLLGWGIDCWLEWLAVHKSPLPHLSGNLQRIQTRQCCDSIWNA